MFESEGLIEFRSRLFFWAVSHFQLAYRSEPDGATTRMEDPYAILSEMQSAQWLSRKKLEEREARKVRAILDHAFRNVPFYRDLYKEAGVDPSNVKTVGELAKLSIVTKDMMRRARSSVLAEDIPMSRVRRAYTSGSTGDPFGFYLDLNWGPRRWASGWLLDSYFGARPQSRYFRLGELRAPPVNVDTAPLLERMRIALNFGLHNEYLIPDLALNQARLPSLLKGILAFRPKYGRGTPSTLVLLIEMMEQAGIAEFPRISAAVSYAEILLETERRLIEERFGCPVFERYGSRDFYGAVAGECEFHAGLHVNEELVYVEIVDENGEGCA